MTTASSGAGPAPRFVVVAAEAFDDHARRGVVFIRHPTRGWEMPGGAIEAGESPVQAAAREFLEETGHELLAPRLVGPSSAGPGALVAGRMGKRLQEPEPGFVQRSPPDSSSRPRTPGPNEWCVVTGWPVLLRLSFPDDPYPDTLRRTGFGDLLTARG